VPKWKVAQTCLFTAQLRLAMSSHVKPATRTDIPNRVIPALLGTGREQYERASEL
jgi:hypothetical protein